MSTIRPRIITIYLKTGREELIITQTSKSINDDEMVSKMYCKARSKTFPIKCMQLLLFFTHYLFVFRSSVHSISLSISLQPRAVPGNFLVKFLVHFISEFPTRGISNKEKWSIFSRNGRFWSDVKMNYVLRFITIRRHDVFKVVYENFYTIYQREEKKRGRGLDNFSRK